MKIVELNESYFEKIKYLFHNKNFTDSVKVHHNTFQQTYLSGLTRFKALGLENDNGNLLGCVSFYMSPNEPVWYGTMVCSNNNKKYVRQLLDAAIEYNEKLGRYRFYTLCSIKQAKLLRRFAFSQKTNSRYGYHDECIIPAKTKCIYQNFWTILFGRILLPVDTVVRCSYLKQEYRKDIPIGGNI
jgi:hypothetical protein